MLDEIDTKNIKEEIENHDKREQRKMYFCLTKI